MDALTPEAQVHLAERFADLMEKWGPWLFVMVLILVIYRKEIGALLLSMRRENSADAMLAQMNASFSQNLHFFEKAVSDTDQIQKNTAAVVQAIDKLREEVIRGRIK